MSRNGFAVVYPKNRGDKRSLLVWDSFCGHLTDSMKSNLQCCSVLQALDKCLNKPFKDNIWRKYQSWLITGPFYFTPAGKKKAPTCNLVLRWVKDTWQEIPADMVKRSFQSCGISNTLDGTEDNAVYTDEMPELL